MEPKEFDTHSAQENPFLQAERERVAPLEDWEVQGLISQLEWLSEQEYANVDEAIRLYNDIPELIRSSQKVKDVVQGFFHLILMWEDLVEIQRCAKIFNISASDLKSENFHRSAKWGIIEQLLRHRFLEAARLAELTGTEGAFSKEIGNPHNSNWSYAVKGLAVNRGETESAGSFFEFLVRYPKYRPPNLYELLTLAVYNPTIARLSADSADVRSWVKAEEWEKLNALAHAVQTVESTRKDEKRIEGENYQLQLLAGAEKVIPLEFQTDPLAFALSHGAELIKQRAYSGIQELIWKLPATRPNTWFMMKRRQFSKTKISEDQEMRILEVAHALQLPGVRPLGTLVLGERYQKIEFDITEYQEGIPGTDISKVLRSRGRSTEEIKGIVAVVEAQLQALSHIYEEAMGISKPWQLKDCLIRLSSDDTVNEVIPLDWERAWFKSIQS